MGVNPSDKKLQKGKRINKVHLLFYSKRGRFVLEKVFICCYSSGVEHFLGKEEVVSSNLTNSSLSACFKQAFCLDDRETVLLSAFSEKRSVPLWWNLRGNEMTEKEKAAQGLLYDANYDRNLIEERLFCKGILYEYNRLHPSLLEERKKLLKKLLGKTGKNLLIEQPFLCDYGYNIEVGENFYANAHCTILDAAKVTFGENVFVAPDCSFYTAGHPFDLEQRNRGLEYAFPIKVGNNVWVGGYVIVLPGVSIGDNSVIGAGSVVSKNIPAGVLAAGNPCKVIREITDDDRRKYKEA